MSEGRHPFARGLHREAHARIEFDEFLRKAEARIAEVSERLPRLAQLKALYGFYVTKTPPNHLQVWFGNRPRTGPDAKLEAERGASLVYTLGAGGVVAVMLFPAESNLARTREGHIYLRLGRLSASRLLAGLEQDLSDLAAYGHVSPIDGDPILGEKFRLFALRKLRPMHVDNEYRQPAFYWLIGKGARFVTQAFFVSLFRTVAFVLVIAALVWFGWNWFAELVAGTVNRPGH